jgi:hypothetical protein
MKRDQGQEGTKPSVPISRRAPREGREWDAGRGGREGSAQRGGVLVV